MILVKVNRLANEKISKIEMTGHADCQIKNNQYDLVCAGVTAIVTGMANAITQQLSSKKLNQVIIISIRDGFADFSVQPDFINCKKIQLFLQTLYFQLLTIEEQYSQSIKIKNIY